MTRQTDRQPSALSSDLHINNSSTRRVATSRTLVPQIPSPHLPLVLLLSFPFSFFSPSLYPFTTLRSRRLKYNWKVCGSAVAPRAGSGPQHLLKSNLMHFSHKIWHRVVSDLVVFPRINWSQCVHFSTCAVVHMTFTKVDIMWTQKVLFVRLLVGQTPGLPDLLLRPCELRLPLRWDYCKKT